MTATAETSTPPHARRLRRDAADNVRRILDAAALVYAESGLDASLTEVAARAGVGMGTIYRRFPDKDALVDALVDEKASLVIKAAEDAVDRPTGWEALGALVENVARVLISDRSVCDLVLSERMRPRIGEVIVRLEKPVSAIMRRAQREGALRKGITFSDLPPLLVMLIGASDLTSCAREDAWRRYLELLLAGLRAESPFPLTVPPLTPTELEAAGRADGWRRG